MIEPISREGAEPTSLWVRQLPQDQEQEVCSPAVAYILTPQVGRGATTQAPANHLLGPQVKAVDQGGASVHFLK